jgi:hypothetical protein
MNVCKIRNYLTKKGWYSYLSDLFWSHKDYPDVSFYVSGGQWALYWKIEFSPQEVGSTFAEFVVATQELEEQKDKP